MPKAACGGVLSLIAYTVVLWATHSVAVGTVSALRETSVLWAAAIGRVFLGEKLTQRKIGSAVLICCGVILLVSSKTAKGATETSDVPQMAWRRLKLQA
jgi:drug/metabolite transporter (DMT)-like permease